MRRRWNPNRAGLGCGVVLLAALVAGGCGSSSSKTASTASSSADTTAQASPTTQPSSPAGSLAVSGFLSLSLTQYSNGAYKCQASQPNTSGMLGFEGSATVGGSYVLQFSIPQGTTTWPGTKGLVAFYDSNDSTKEWSIGTARSSNQTGTLTFDGTRGTLDISMLPDPPRPNPALTPIHLKGTFSC
jgi:hypothetical protein